MQKVIAVAICLVSTSCERIMQPSEINAIRNIQRIEKMETVFNASRGRFATLDELGFNSECGRWSNAGYLFSLYLRPSGYVIEARPLVME
jgi:hypothetical protein